MKINLVWRVNTNPAKKTIRKEGQVIEALPNTFFRVKLTDGKDILAFLSGKMRLNKIMLIPGDKVKVEISPYDLTKGRIMYRL